MWARLFEMFDNVNLIDNVHAELLVIHGENDSIVPFELGKRLFAKSKNPHLFIPVSGANHNDLIQVYGFHKFMDRINEFIKH